MSGDHRTDENDVTNSTEGKYKKTEENHDGENFPEFREFSIPLFS